MDIPSFFLDVFRDVYRLENVVFAVGFFELLENDGGFVAVWRAEGEQLDACGGDEAGGTGGGHGAGCGGQEMLGGLEGAVEGDS